MYILDCENAIVVIKNDDKSINDSNYIMIHKRLLLDTITEVNRWYLKYYHFGSIHNVTVIKKLGLFKVQNISGAFGSLYDYKNGKFVINQDEFEMLKFGENDSMIKKYNGVLGLFSIFSDYEKDDVFSYTNPVTKEKLIESFSVSDGCYYAILNLDGTIRGNKLFKGSSFSKIEEVIDLNKYNSLSEFKNEVKELCNYKKKKPKEAYYQMIKSRDDGSVSPYLDSEVEKILSLKK